MSKVDTEFKLKDLYAIKHALEFNIHYMQDYIETVGDNCGYTEIKEQEPLVEQYKKDIVHEKKIVDYIVEEISKFKRTEEHYTEKIEMRAATKEEQNSIQEYIESISKPTGVNYFDL